MLSVPAYWTFGHLVRHRPELDLVSFWVVLFLATAAVIAGFHLPTAAAFATGAILVGLTGRAARRWKARLIEIGPNSAGA